MYRTGFTVARVVVILTSLVSWTVVGQDDYKWLPIVTNHLLNETVETENSPVTITGERRRWHRITLDFDGPDVNENDDTNPFTDYRLEVTFSQGQTSYTVPGFFAADGNAAETSATGGSVWRVRFAPDKTGTWNYVYSFVTGSNVAVNGGGSPVLPMHGARGSFNVSETNKSGRDFRAGGRLAYVGERYLKQLGSDKYFLKVGADAPEGLLGYADFDGTSNQNGGSSGIKTFGSHVNDWQSGDPVWKSDKGKGLIGALNYLASEGQNAFSFLTYSVGGDSKTVWPFIGPFDRLRYDVSKLAQWEVVFSHADKLGLYLHFKTQETENDNGTNGLDGGNVGLQRKLYYRELIARFGHHLGLNWNLGEENSQTEQQARDMAQYFFDTDPYNHLVVMHTYPGQQNQKYTPLLGNGSELTGASIQINWNQVHSETLEWVDKSIAAGQPWVVANDEQGNANTGVPPDIGYNGYTGTSVSQDDIRHQTLWGNLMAGGAGVEYYFGYQQPCTDLTCEDWRSRDNMWDYNRYAWQFFDDYLPFSEMENCNDLIDNENNSDDDGYCLGKTNEVYAVYLPPSKTVELDISSSTLNFEVRWYNPRSGGALQSGDVSTIQGGDTRSLGSPPGDSDKDWVVLITGQS
ncbi:MAG: DUF5060 domain-containing protein [Pseudomonadota bacterium]